jgi:hypothetical protein
MSTDPHLPHSLETADRALHTEQTQPVGGLLSGVTGVEEDEFWRFASGDVGVPLRDFGRLERLGFGVTMTGPVLVFKVMVPPPRGEDAGDGCVAGVSGEARVRVGVLAWLASSSSSSP